MSARVPEAVVGRLFGAGDERDTAEAPNTAGRNGELELARDVWRLRLLPVEEPDESSLRIERQPPSSELAGLSLRQHEIMALVASGFSSDEIGTRLFLAPSTVKFHMTAIVKKLGARNRTHAAVIWALSVETRADRLDALAAELEVIAKGMRSRATVIRRPKY